MAQGTVRYRLTFFIAIMSMALLGGWLGTLAADREEPVVMYSAEAMTPIVKAGGELRVEYSLLRRRSCEVNSDRFIFDARKTRFEIPDLNIRAGLPVGPDHYVVPVRVDDDAAPGNAVYRTITAYSCNPLQRLWPIHGGVRDIPFIIR